MIKSVLNWLRNHLQLIIGILISAACLVYVFAKVDFTELWRIFANGKYDYLLPGLLLLVGINMARAMRWRVLMGEKTIPVLQVFAIVNIGYLFNNVLPAKAGEVVRAYLAGRKLKGGLGQGASSLVVERLLDVLVVVFLALGLLPFVDLPQWLVQGGILLGIVALVGIVILAVLSRLSEAATERFWAKMARIPVLGHPIVKRLVTSLVEGFGVLTDAGILLRSLAWSLVVWLGYALLNYVLFLALGMTDLPFVAALTVLCATGLSMVVPSSPGAIGPFEAAAVLVLTGVFAVGNADASAYAFGLHMFTNLTLIVYGLLSLRSQDLSFSDVRRDILGDSASVDSTD